MSEIVFIWASTCVLIWLSTCVHILENKSVSFSEFKIGSKNHGLRKTEELN